MTRLCVPIFVESVDQARAQLARAIEAGAEIVELRVDTITDASDVLRVAQGFDVPLILTCRASYEGGHSELSDAERWELLTTCAETLDAWIDYEQAAEEQGSHARVIRSSHDFTTRPADLTQRFVRMQQSDAAVAKLAWTARSVRDNIEAFELMRAGPKPTIAICMGEAGQTSRILAKKFGAFLTFASLDHASGTAPGQVTIDDLKRLYRWDAITPATRIFGVVGSPVSHSMSPAIHNAGFDETGFDGAYLPLLVNPGYESFKAFMESWLAFAPIQLSGLSVTLPHKENALRYAIEKGWAIDPVARSIGAINTLVLNGAPRGFSSDADAIVDSLGVSRTELASKRIAVIGAGGTGRTAVAALAALGATVVVYNRTRERADALAQEFNGRSGRVVSADWSKLCGSCCDIILNTTSMGMKPNIDSSPFDDHSPALTAGTIVFDAVYNPLETKLILQARQAGSKVVTGDEMFIRQAVGQFEAWTGHAAPIETMRHVLRARLGAG
jgi:3-dehydroquinate dehydratase/shikimate dehydrogenase